ncbi:MAG: XdhC family protein [Gemmatimonadota bacterium]
MTEVLEAALAAIAGGRPAALVTPVATEGSVPTGRQARMLVYADGTSVGTVGGGKMEAEATAAAAGAGQMRLLDFALTARDAMSDGLLCGGRATFLVEPLGPASRPGLEAILDLAQRRACGMEVVRLDGSGAGRRLVLGVAGERAGDLASPPLEVAAAALLSEVVGEDVCGTRALAAGAEQAEAFVNALTPRPTLYLFGGGHVGLALARIAPTAGFRLVVVDDRAEFASAARFPMADEVRVRPFDRALEGLELDRLSYVAIMTPGHQGDRQVLAQALRTPAGYIGMIGSRRKIATLFEALRQQGFSDGDLARVHAPIGLPIGGDSPGEIAVSILAQLIQVHRLGELAG